MFPDKLIPYVIDYAMTGSRAIANPAPMDTDEDWVVYVHSLSDFEKILLSDGWVRDSVNYGDARLGPVLQPNSPVNQFAAYRKDELNLIVTTVRVFYTRYRFATRIARALNLVKKEDRIALFHMIRDMPQEVLF